MNCPTCGGFPPPERPNGMIQLTDGNGAVLATRLYRTPITPSPELFGHWAATFETETGRGAYQALSRIVGPRFVLSAKLEAMK